MKKILVIGGTSRHMQRWFKNVVPELGKDCQVDMFCTSKKETAFPCANNIFHAGPATWLGQILKHIPKLRGKISVLQNKKSLFKLVEEGNYDIVNIHQPAAWLLPVMRLAKNRHCKVILTPWGSDVLRCSDKQRKGLAKMFAEADCVTCNIQGFRDKLMDIYQVPINKFVAVGFGSEVFDLIPMMKGKYTKAELADALGVPQGEYYIACGYTAQKAQRHLLMVEAIGRNSQVLPVNTVLLFQFTYGDNSNQEYIQEISSLCEHYHLQYHFLMTYLSNEDMARLRLLTDLFIHIQPTDAGNASLQEFLLSGAQCINGKWLAYPMLEQDGFPYHTCETLEQLPNIIGDVLSGKVSKTEISVRTHDAILEGSWNRQKKNWAELLNK